MLPSLLKIERARRQSIWNLWSSRHDPESWAMYPRNGILPIKGEECGEKREIASVESRVAPHSTSWGAKVERETGFEPATSTLARSRSTK